MKMRNIGLSIFLSIITCGIYAIYWFVVLTNETNEASGHATDEPSGGIAFLFSLITCGIYGIYWAYKMGEKMNEAKAARNIPSDSNTGILYLILSVIGLQVIVYALIQNDMNKMSAQ